MFENPSTQIVFRTVIFRKLTLGAPDTFSCNKILVNTVTRQNGQIFSIGHSIN